MSYYVISTIKIGKKKWGIIQDKFTIFIIWWFQVRSPTDTSNFDFYPQDCKEVPDELSNWDIDFWRDNVASLLWCQKLCPLSMYMQQLPQYLWLSKNSSFSTKKCTEGMYEVLQKEPVCNNVWPVSLLHLNWSLKTYKTFCCNWKPFSRLNGSFLNNTQCHGQRPR